MIQLYELPIGNALKTSGEIAFRCKGTIAVDQIPIIPITQYFLIGKDTEVQPIGLIAEYTSGQNPHSKKKLSVIPSGTVCWTCNSFGLTQNILVTENEIGGVMMVASLGVPRIMTAVSRILDLGPIKDYKGPRIAFDQLRTCPNCLNVALKSNATINDEGIMSVSGTCYNCRCNVNITW